MVIRSITFAALFFLAGSDVKSYAQSAFIPMVGKTAVSAAIPNGSAMVFQYPDYGSTKLTPGSAAVRGLPLAKVKPSLFGSSFFKHFRFK